MRTEHLKGMGSIFCVCSMWPVEQRMCYPACTPSSGLLLTPEVFALINTGAVPLGGEGIRGKEKSGFIKSGITAGPEKKTFFLSLPAQL